MRMVPSMLAEARRAVRAERHAPAPAGVSAEAEHLPAGRRIPDAHRLVFAARSEAPAVRAEGDALDVSGMQIEGVEQLAGRRIPQLHGPVEAGRGQPLAVRAERQRADGMAMCVGWCASGPPCFRRPRASGLPAQIAGRQAARRG